MNNSEKNRGGEAGPKTGPLPSLYRLPGSETELRSAGYVLQEAVQRLMACAGDIADADDKTLEEAAESGYAPEIREQAEAFLLARNALRMTNYLFPPNVEARNRDLTETDNQGEK